METDSLGPFLIPGNPTPCDVGVGEVQNKDHEATNQLIYSGDYSRNQNTIEGYKQVLL